VPNRVADQSMPGSASSLRGGRRGSHQEHEEKAKISTEYYIVKRLRDRVFPPSLASQDWTLVITALSIKQAHDAS
jgi:hypothetical protein